MTAPSTEPREGWYINFDRYGEPFCMYFDGKVYRKPDFPDIWTLGPRLDDLMRDAARYPKLRESFRATVRASDGKPGYWSAVESEKCLTAAEFDAEIDAEIAREEGR